MFLKKSWVWYNQFITIPKFDETFLPTLKVLSDEKEWHKKDLNNEVLKRFFWDKLSEEDKKEKNNKSGKLKIVDNITFGFYYLKMGNFVFQPRRGYFKITQKGIDWLKSEKKLDRNILKQDSDFIEYKHKKKNKNDSVVDDKIEIEKDDENNTEEILPIDKIKEGFLELENELKNDLLSRLRNSDPYYFEKIILKLFKKMGYGDFETTKKSGDGGIDGIIKQDALGIEKIYTQAKRYTAEKVSEKEIRDFKGAIDDRNVTKGIFVTTSDFDNKASESAKKSRNKIILINGNQLVDLMFRYNLGVEESDDYKEFKVKQIDEDFFLEDNE